MSRRAHKNVGIIGLGIIGQRVADTLRRKGFSVFVWNRTPRPFPNFVGSPAEIAQLADFIQIFVADDEALLEMVHQLKPELKSHHIVMVHCTVAPHSMRAAAEIVQRRGAQFLDAPFTGSKLAAEKGELVYYIGGDEAALRRARPILEASSKEIIEIGEIGQATTIKVATNMVTAATVQVASEALAIVRGAGMGPEKFLTAMKGNASGSGTLAMKLPKMIAGDFDPHFSVKHMLKDVEIATRLARSQGLVLGATEAARGSLREEVRHERGDCDYSSMVRAFFPETSALHPVEEVEEPAADLTLGLVEVPVKESAVEPIAASASPVVEEKLEEPVVGVVEVEEKISEPVVRAVEAETEAAPELAAEKERVPEAAAAAEEGELKPVVEEPALETREEAPVVIEPVAAESETVLEVIAGRWPADEPKPTAASTEETAEPTASDEQPILAEEDQVATEEPSAAKEGSVVIEDELVVADDEPTEIADEPVIEKENAVTPNEEPAAPEKKAEPERRGFFSRVFGSKEVKDVDY
ncbi:MAG: NAD(P)-binding domain-containing protein [Chthoniobacterales bacterium]